MKNYSRKKCPREHTGGPVPQDGKGKGPIRDMIKSLVNR